VGSTTGHKTGYLTFPESAEVAYETADSLHWESLPEAIALSSYIRSHPIFYTRGSKTGQCLQVKPVGIWPLRHQDLNSSGRYGVLLLYFVTDK
jgi:hypothetical protein